MKRECSGCGRYSCDGIACFLVEPELADEETISTMTLDDCRRLYGDLEQQIQRDLRFTMGKAA